MVQLPFELRYDLTRKQRWVVHFKIWRPHLLNVVLLMGAASLAAVRLSAWYVLAVLFVLFVFRGFFLGLMNILLVGHHPVDLVIEENGLGFLLGKERWWLSLDGLTAFGELAEGLWTIQHWNGSVVSIPKALLTPEQVEFFREWVAKADAIRNRLGIRSR